MPQTGIEAGLRTYTQEWGIWRHVHGCLCAFVPACMRLCLGVCVCVCVCVRDLVKVCAGVCVCVCIPPSCVWSDRCVSCVCRVRVVCVPVGMGGGQHELELHHTGVVTELPVLNTVELVGDVSPSHVHLLTSRGRQRRGQKGDMHGTRLQRESEAERQREREHQWWVLYLQRGHPHHLVAVVEEVGQYVKDGRLRQDEFLLRERERERERERGTREKRERERENDFILRRKTERAWVSVGRTRDSIS